MLRIEFQVADLDHDKSLTLDEFRAFAMPEMFSRMHYHMVEETLGDLDSDSDQHLSVDEYLTTIIQGTAILRLSHTMFHSIRKQ